MSTSHLGNNKTLTRDICDQGFVYYHWFNNTIVYISCLVVGIYK